MRTIVNNHIYILIDSDIQQNLTNNLTQKKVVRRCKFRNKNLFCNPKKIIVRQFLFIILAIIKLKISTNYN